MKITSVILTKLWYVLSSDTILIAPGVLKPIIALECFCLHGDWCSFISYSIGFGTEPPSIKQITMSPLSSSLC